MASEESIPLEALEAQLLSRPADAISLPEARVILDSIGWEAAEGRAEIEELAVVEFEIEAAEAAQQTQHLEDSLGGNLVAVHRGFVRTTEVEPDQSETLVAEVKNVLKRIYQETTAAGLLSAPNRFGVVVNQRELTPPLILSITSTESTFRELGFN